MNDEGFEFCALPVGMKVVTRLEIVGGFDVFVMVMSYVMQHHCFILGFLIPRKGTLYLFLVSQSVLTMT